MNIFLRGGTGLVMAVIILFSLAAPSSASAASLTEPQIQAILGLLVAFEVPQATINNVNTILHGGSSAPAPASHIRGSASAKVTIVEYCDTESSYCKTFHSTMRSIFSEYQAGGKLAWEYKSFPLSQIYSKTNKEAQALECVADLGGNGAFWQYVDMVYEITPSENGLDPAKLTTIATGVGLSRTAFEKCLNSGQMVSVVSQSYDAGIAAGVQGTPTSFLIKGASRVSLQGAQSYSSVKASIDALLTK